MRDLLRCPVTPILPWMTEPASANQGGRSGQRRAVPLGMMPALAAILCVCQGSATAAAGKGLAEVASGLAGDRARVLHWSVALVCAVRGIGVSYEHAPGDDADAVRPGPGRAMRAAPRRDAFAHTGRADERAVRGELDLPPPVRA